MSSINLEIEEKERKKITDTLNSGTDHITLPPLHSIPGIPTACTEEGLDTTNAWQQPVARLFSFAAVCSGFISISTG